MSAMIVVILLDLVSPPLKQKMEDVVDDEEDEEAVNYELTTARAIKLEQKIPISLSHSRSIRLRPAKSEHRQNLKRKLVDEVDDEEDEEAANDDFTTARAIKSKIPVSLSHNSQSLGPANSDHRQNHTKSRTLPTSTLSAANSLADLASAPVPSLGEQVATA